MKELLEQMTMMYEVMGKQEFADAIATMLYNIYITCSKKGFTNEEAMAITLSFAKSQTVK